MDTKVLRIATPAGLYEGSFEERATVRDVIAIVVREKCLAEGDEFELVFDGETMTLDLRVSSLRLDACAVLDLIATGSGV